MCGWDLHGVPRLLYVVVRLLAVVNLKFMEPAAPIEAGKGVMGRYGLLGTVGVAAGMVVAAAVPALAAGYTPGSPPGGTGPSGAFAAVVYTSTVQPSGGTFTAAVSGEAATFSVPPGTFTQPTQLVLTKGSVHILGNAGVTGTHAVVAFGISFVQSGAKLTGTLTHTVALTFTGPGLAPGDQLLELLPGGGSTVVPSARFSAGKVTFGVDSDPDFEVVAPNASATPVCALSRRRKRPLPHPSPARPWFSRGASSG